MSVEFQEKPARVAVGAPKQSTQLPDRPVYSNREKRTLFAAIKEIWQFRELCYFFCWRDLKVRYRQTMLGMLWVVIQPLVSMVIFSYFFGRLAKISSDGIPHSIFYFAGLLLWIFFSNTVTNCSSSLTSDHSLITKIYFPRMLLPAAVVLAGLVDMFIAFGLLLVIVVAQGYWPNWRWVALPLIFTLTATLTYSLGMILAGLNLRYRDVRYALPFVIQLLFFINPVLFPLSIVPEKHRWIITLLNPLSTCIEQLRACLVGRQLDWLALGLATLMVATYLAVCSYIFRIFERTFAEKI